VRSLSPRVWAEATCSSAKTSSTSTCTSLEEGPQRFGALQRLLQGVSPKVLTQTLRRLEDAGLVDRTVYPAVPLHVEYALTALGHSAAVPLSLLRSWVEEDIDRVDCVPGRPQEGLPVTL
jgi:DNA-binding HxlR family transcriptional regulator